MSLKVRIALLLCLMGAALFTAADALRQLSAVTVSQIPEEIYEHYTRRAGEAAFFLRREGDYIAVYEGKRSRSPARITGIELESLRRADRAMIEAGLPVGSRRELLQLLEDLGS